MTKQKELKIPTCILCSEDRTKDKGQRTQDTGHRMHDIQCRLENGKKVSVANNTDNDTA